MDFRILGSLEVEGDGQLLSLGGPKQRAVLAALLLHLNQVVSRDELIETVWDGRPPETAVAALQGYIANVRKTLGSGYIVTRPPGYVLQADPLALDVGRFEELRRRGTLELSTGDAEAAARTFETALGLWRGEPLADLDSGTSVATERLRLEELRVGVIEDRIDADLALGRHAELIAELQTLVREHPVRERLSGQLMLALYRSGRQAEALDAYQQIRRRLAEELGLEPGEALKRLQRGLLEHDPTLGPPAPPVGRMESARRPRLRRPWLLVAGLVVAGVVVATVFGVTSGSSELAVRPDSIAVIDPSTNTLVDDIPVGRRPAAVAVGEGGVWVGNADDGTVSHIDPRTREVVGTTPIRSDVHDVATGFGSIWVAGGMDGTVTRIDVRTGKTKTLLVGRDPVFWIAADATGVWATRGQVLVRIDPRTDRVTARVPLSAQPTGLTTGRGSVWITTEDNLLTVLRGKVRHTPDSFQGGALAPAVGAGSAWVIVYVGQGLIQPINPASLTWGPATQTHAFPLDVTVGRRAVWAVDIHGNVLRIDPATAETVARIPTAPTARSAIAAGDGAVWVAIQQPS